MKDRLKELNEDFKDQPDYQQLSVEEKLRIISGMEKMMAMGMSGIYGDESEDQPDTDAPCSKLSKQCQAKCCSFIFALTKGEVEKGIVQYNKDKPFYCP